jgi:hypothetical protein
MKTTRSGENEVRLPSCCHVWVIKDFLIRGQEEPVIFSGRRRQDSIGRVGVKCSWQAPGFFDNIQGDRENAPIISLQSFAQPSAPMEGKFDPSPILQASQFGPGNWRNGDALGLFDQKQC